MVEPLKRPWSPISTASDTAVRALTPRRQARRLAVGAGPAVVGGDRRWPHQAGRGVRWRAPPCRRRHRRPPAHWAPYRSRGRGGHAAARRRGSGFRAPGAVIDDPAAQQHPGTGGGGPSIRSPRAPGARAHQVTGPLLGTGGDPHRDDIVVARQAGQQDRVPAIGLDPLAARAQQLGGRRHLAGDPLLGQGPGKLETGRTGLTASP